MPLRRYSHEIGLTAVVLIWGANFSVLKGLFAVFHPYVANALRLSLALVSLALLLVFVLPKFGEAARTAIRANGWKIAGLGLFGFFLYQVAFVEGLARTSPTSAALLMATAPLWTALSAHLTRIERLTPAAWGALLVSVAGAALVVAGARTASDVVPDTLAGNLIILAAALCWGLFTTLSRPLTQSTNAALLSVLEMIVALPLLLLVALPLLPDVDWSLVDGGVVAALAFSGTLSSGITFVIWNRAIRHVGPTSTIAFANAVPLAAAAFGYLLLDVPVTLVQVGGGLCIIGGIVLLRRVRRREARLRPVR